MKSASLKRTAAFALALICAAFSACVKPGGEPSPTADATEEPPVPYEMKHIVRYWPEDADYDTCDYACIAELPEFTNTKTAGYAMNQQVDEYYDRLCGRIEAEYMQAAIARPPYTEVKCTVEFIGEIANVIFSENHCYEAQPETRTYVLMMDARGNELNLCDVIMNYHAERMAAERIAEKIKGDEGYYEADADMIAAALDINHGAKAAENGCVVYVPAGKLAPYEEGELAFELTNEELAPDLVKDGTVSLEEYRALTEFLGFVSDGVVVRSQEIEDGTLTEYVASSFMGEFAQGLGIAPEAGRINVPEERFLSLFKECFGTEFPGIDTDAHDIKFEDGVYKVRYTQKPYRYNVDMLDAEREGDVLTVTGDLIFGEFGYAATQYVCHVSAKLIKNSASPYGFTLEEFKLSM